MSSINSDLGVTRESARRLRSETSTGLAATNVQKALEALAVTVTTGSFNSLTASTLNLTSTADITLPLPYVPASGALQVQGGVSIYKGMQVLGGYFYLGNGTTTGGVLGTGIVDFNLNGSASGSNGGAVVDFDNGGTQIMTIGNFSAVTNGLVSGVYDATPTWKSNKTTGQLFRLVKHITNASVSDALVLNTDLSMNLYGNVTIGSTTASAGTNIGILINSPSSGTGVGTSIGGVLNTTVAWAVGNVSALEGGAADTTMLLKNDNGAYRFKNLREGIFTALPNGTVSSFVASQAQAENGTNTTAPMTPLATAEAIMVQPAGFKNIMGRNGGIEVWQRLINNVTSVAVAASTTAYTADGWYLKTAANEISTVTQIAGLSSQSRFGVRVQRNQSQTGTGAMYYEFPLDTDEIYRMRGQQVALSFQVSTGASWSPTNGTLTANLYVGTGNPAKRNSSAYTNETNPISFSNNVATNSAAALKVSALSSTITTAASQAAVQFTWTPTGTAGANDWFAIDDVDLRVITDGVAPVTPLFERTDYAMDFARCCRHLYVVAPAAAGSIIGFGQVFGTPSNAFTITAIPQPLRGAAAVTLSANSDFNLYSVTAGSQTVTGLTAGSLAANQVLLNLTATALVAGNATGLSTANVNAAVYASAEI